MHLFSNLFNLFFAFIIKRILREILSELLESYSTYVLLRNNNINKFLTRG